MKESPFWIYFNVNKLVTRNKRNLWNLNDCNGIEAHNLIVSKRSTIYPK